MRYCCVSKRANKIKKVQERLKTEDGLLNDTMFNLVLDSLGIQTFSKTVLPNKSAVFRKNFDPLKRYVVKAEAKKLIHKKEWGAVQTRVKSININDVVFEMFDKLNTEFNDLKITIEEEVKGYEAIIGLKSGLIYFLPKYSQIHAAPRQEF